MGRRKGRLSIELTSDGEGEESKESAMLEPSRTRVNGFQRPFARDQVVAWIAHAITALMFSFLLLCFIISSNTTLSQYQVFFVSALSNPAVHETTPIDFFHGWTLYLCRRRSPDSMGFVRNY